MIDSLVSQSLVPPTALSMPPAAPPAAQPMAPPAAQMQPTPQMPPPQPTVLSQPVWQDKLTNGFDRMLKSAVDGFTAPQKNEFAGTKIFTGAAAALGGLMGPGTAQGGLQALNLVKQQVQDARGERSQQARDALSGVQTLASILRNTGKDEQQQVATGIKEAQKNQELDIKQQRANSYAETVKSRISQGADRNNILRKHYDALDKLKLDANDIAWAKLDQAAELHEESSKLKRELATMQANASKYRTDKNYLAHMQELQTKVKLADQMRKFSAQKFDDEMTARLGRRDKDNNLVYGDTTVPSLVDMLEPPVQSQTVTPTIPPLSAPLAQKKMGVSQIPKGYNGNIDIANRQIVDFPKGLDDSNSTPAARKEFGNGAFPPGSYGSEFSTRITDGDHEVSIPTIFDGKVHSGNEAIAHYRQTGQYLGKFAKGTPAKAMDDYENGVHSREIKVNGKVYTGAEQAPSLGRAKSAFQSINATMGLNKEAFIAEGRRRGKTREQAEAIYRSLGGK